MASSATTTTLCVPSGLGTLSKLPREVRDEIYRYLVKARYYASGGSISVLSDYHANAAIIRVSKPISDEVMSIFYSESIFNFFLYARSPKAHIDRMMRIHYHIHDFGGYFPPYKNAESLQRSKSENIKTICDNTIGQLVGTDVTRSRIWITLYDIKDLTHAFTSPFFQAFVRLRECRRFSLELRFSLIVNFDSDERIDIQVACDRMMKYMWAVEAYLVPALGPLADGCLGLRNEDEYCGILTFEPYQHLTNVSAE